MKKIKSRWFAMLLILSLVFTMGMPMGMTAFGAETTELDAAIAAAATAAEDAAAKGLLAEEAAKAATTAQEAAANAQTAADAAKATADAKVAEAALVDAADEASKTAADAAAAEATALAAAAQTAADAAKAEADAKATAAAEAKAAADASKVVADEKQAEVDRLKSVSTDVFASFKKPDPKPELPAEIKTITVNVGAGGIAVVENDNDNPLLPNTTKMYEKVKASTQYTVRAYANPGFALDCDQEQKTRGTGDATITVTFKAMDPVHGLPYYSPDGSFSGHNGVNFISDVRPMGDKLEADLDVSRPKTAKLGDTVNITLKVDDVNGDRPSNNQLNEVDFHDGISKQTFEKVREGKEVTFSYQIPSTVEQLKKDGYTRTLDDGKTYFVKVISFDMVDRYNDTAAAALLDSAKATIKVLVPDNANIYITADDYYELYVDGNFIGKEKHPADNGWMSVEKYPVFLEDDSVVAVYAKDVKQTVDGLSVKIDYSGDKPDVETQAGGLWHYYVLKGEGVNRTAPEGWKTAASVGPEWKSVAATTYDWNASIRNWNVPWVWSPKSVEPSFDTEVLFRYNGAAPASEMYTIKVEADTNGTAYIGTQGTTSKTVSKGSKITLTAISNEGYLFDHWTDKSGDKVGGVPTPGSEFTVTVTGDATYTAHFVEAFAYTLTLDPADNDIGVAKDKKLTMTFNGRISPELIFKDDGEGVANYFEIYSADGKLFDSFGFAYGEGKEARAADDSKLTMISPNAGSVGYIQGNQVVLNPINDFVPGETYYVLTKGLSIWKAMYLPAADGPQSPDYAWFNGFRKKEAVQDQDWNFTIASDSGTPGGPSTPGTPQTTVTTVIERDRADGPVATTAIAAEPTPLAAPVIPAPAALAAPAKIVEEAIPLGVPVLPKTGEIPASLFYGIGGILAAAGAFMKRK